MPYYPRPILPKKLRKSGQTVTISRCLLAQRGVEFFKLITICGIQVIFMC